MSCEANISTLLFPRTSIKVIATIINSILYLRKLRHREFKYQYLAQLYTTSKGWSESSDSAQEFVLFLYMQNLLNILSLIFVFPLKNYARTFYLQSIMIRTMSCWLFQQIHRKTHTHTNTKNDITESVYLSLKSHSDVMLLSGWCSSEQ